MLRQQDLEFLLYNLSKSVWPSDVFRAWNSVDNTKDMCAILTLPGYDKSAYPAGLYNLINSVDSSFVPYFQSDKLYFMEDKLLEEMFTNQPRNVDFGIDYSIMLDSNYSSYIHEFVAGTMTSNNKIKSTIELLIRREFQYDYIFYLIENYYNHFYINGVDPQKSQENKNKLFMNMASLERFKNIDKEEYFKTGNLKYNISLQEAILNADYLYQDFYYTEKGKEILNKFIAFHAHIVLFLIGVFKIRFQSSKSSSYKLAELFDHLDNVVGVYLDRETIVAHKFFENPKNVQILNKVNKGMKRQNLYKKINNIAWDFTVPRIMEYLIQLGGEGRFFLPFFLSNDENLRELLRLYNVKGVLFKKNMKGFFPFTEETNVEYYQRNGCREDFEMFISTERVEKRKRNINREKFDFSIIDDEFDKLANVLECL